MTPRQESIEQGGEIVSRLYILFDDYNERFFSGQLDDVYISITRDLPTDRMGSCHVDRRDGIPRNHITITRGLIGCDGDLTYASDVLLHELVHAAINQRAGFPRGNGDPAHRGAFAALCNKISQKMGIDERVVSHRYMRKCKRKRARKRHDARHWPHCLRSDQYRRELERLTKRDLEQRQATEAKQQQETRDNGMAAAFNDVFAWLYQSKAPQEIIQRWAFLERQAHGEAGRQVSGHSLPDETQAEPRVF